MRRDASACARSWRARSTSATPRASGTPPTVIRGPGGVTPPRRLHEPHARRAVAAPEACAAPPPAADEPRRARRGGERNFGRRRAGAAAVRPRQGWSDADLPLLDEARALLEGGERPHGHVIVDEAQDLTPMQLRMLARRSTGSSRSSATSRRPPDRSPIAAGTTCSRTSAPRRKSRSCAWRTACRATCSSSRSRCSH